MNDSVDTVVNLHSQLDLTVVGEGDTAYGTIGDSPVTMTVLTLEPLALLFAINVNRKSGKLPLPPEFAAMISPDTCQVSVENERAWLSLYNLTGAPATQIVGLLERFHEILIAEGFAVGAGCLRCNSLDDLQLIHVEQRTTRICQTCLDNAVAEKQEKEDALNATSVAAKLGVPAVVVIAAMSWALAWFGVDGAFELLRIREIHLNRLTVTLLFGMYTAIGLVVGAPLGMTLRKSGTVRAAPIPLSCVFTLSAVSLGEFIYVALLLLWNAGILNFAVAAELLGHVIASYSKFWIVSKLAGICAVGITCCICASEKKTVRLNV